MTKPSASECSPPLSEPSSKSSRARSALWTALLIPFVFLPYRWVWAPCASAATLLIAPSARSRAEVTRANETLIFGSAIILIVRTALDPGWWLPWMAVLALTYWLRGHSWCKTGIRAIAIPLVWVAAAGILARPIVLLPRTASEGISSEAILVCAGDSLTSGLDLKSDAETYVARLRSRLPCKVVNAGRASDRVGDLLARLDKTVLGHKPIAVVLFIGGNDFLDGTPRAQFADRFEAVVSRVAASGARLVIVEVPVGIVWNRYAGVYRKVANRYGAMLVPESRLRWWFTVELLARDYLAEPLTIDGIHLSPAGATKVADWLEPYARRALVASSSAAS